MSPIRICIFSSVHLAHDVRLFQAEARTLARAGFDVRVMALRDSTPSDTDGAVLFPLPRPANRWTRLFHIPRVFWWAWRQHADLYAFHDPELLPAAALLGALTRRPVIYDVHEDVPASIRNRSYLPGPLRRPVAALYRLVERASLPFLAGLTLADEAYGRYYRGQRSITILNYPLRDHTNLYKPVSELADEPPTLVYAGSVTRLRGLAEMIALVARLRPRFPGIRLVVVGPFGSAADAAEARRLIEELDIDGAVEFTGLVSHADVHRHILRGHVGLALLHPDPNYLRSLPTKMFEYMMMGRPVVVSSFPLWSRIVEEAACGYAVDPLDGQAVFEAVARLLEDGTLRQRLGEAGPRAVLECYSWQREGERLVAFYREVLAEYDETTSS